MMAEAGALVRSRLAGLGRLDDCDIGLAEAALLLAALDHPRAAIDGYLAYIAELADEVRVAAAGADDSVHLATALFEVIGRRHRFRGDDRDDDDVANANLMDVIDHRRGVADALGLLTLEVARRAGLIAEGLAFPPHFLLRIADAQGQRIILDPFGGGRALGPPDLRAMLKAAAGMAAELEPVHYAPLGNRALLVRLQTDVKMRLLRCGRIDRALGVVESTLLFAPDIAPLWREAGLMHMRLDNPGGAVAALEQFVARTPNAQARARTLSLLAELKGRPH